MVRSQIIIRNMGFFICLFSFLFGCSNKTEPLPKPKVTAGKIIIKTTDLSKKMADVSHPEESEIKKDASAAVAKESEIKPKSEISATQKETASKQVSAPIVEEDEKKKPVEIAYSYDPKGKIDPFMQWFKEESPASSVVKIPIKKRIPLTPLEKLDWSQLKLVGIIRASSGNRALIEETSGKGYIIKKGTYIGPHRGIVTKILKDRVIIEEVVEYGISKSSVRKKELTLQKPPGEE